MKGITNIAAPPLGLLDSVWGMANKFGFDVPSPSKGLADSITSQKAHERQMTPEELEQYYAERYERYAARDKDEEPGDDSWGYEIPPLDLDFPAYGNWNKKRTGLMG